MKYAAVLLSFITLLLSAGKAMATEEPKYSLIEKDGAAVEQTANTKDYQFILESQILKMKQLLQLKHLKQVPFR